MAKYDPLRDFLAGLPAGQKQVSMGFRRIEQLLGEPLPPSALKYEAWWFGGKPDYARGSRGPSRNVSWQDQVQTQAWEEAGWTIDELDLQLRMVTFRRR